MREIVRFRNTLAGRIEPRTNKMPSPTQPTSGSKTALDLLVSIQEQSQTKSPELAAKQARLIEILKRELKVEPPPDSKR
jgi:hypothetical protein